MTLLMYEQPTKEDLGRNLSAVFHAAHHQARDEKSRLIMTYASRGTLDSSMFVSAVVECVNKAHVESIRQAMEVLREFGSRMNVPASEIVAWVKPHLDNNANTLLGVLLQGPANLSTASRNYKEQAHLQYDAVFKQRIEGALRDFEIGFIGGRNIRPTEKEVVSLKPSWFGFGIDLTELWRRLRNRMKARR